MKKYNYLIVGAGLFGAVFANECTKSGKTCLVIDKRGHIGGNSYTENIEGINVHKYGPHIFHTDDEEIWRYMNSFAPFNRFTNAPVARFNDEIYNLPFNMNTFNKMWGVITPQEAKAKIAEQIKSEGITEPKNLEEQAVSLVGRDVFEKLVKGYTEKQWGRKCSELPAFIIKRLPVRFTYDNNYFNDRFQGIPIGGYTQIFEKMLENADVRLNTDFNEHREELTALADKIIYTGTIDSYFDYCFGRLEYRSLRFETEVLNTENYQGNAVVNYTSGDVDFTRIIEHKHFEFAESPVTVITHEYPQSPGEDCEPYYPVNDEKNNKLYDKYKELADKEENVIFGGRLGMYRYFDMHKIISAALDCAENELKK